MLELIFFKDEYESRLNFLLSFKLDYSPKEMIKAVGNV